MGDRYSRRTDRGREIWSVERLWEAAADLSIISIPISDIAEFDVDCWFQGVHEPTCRAVADHARRINAADLSHPIILAADGALMDGGHRIAKAWLMGQTELSAVRFEIDPEPDRIEPIAD